MKRTDPRTLAVLFAALAVFPSQAAVLITQEEALVLAFPEAEVVRHTAYLDDAQLESARGKAGRGVEFPSAVVPYYIATKDGALRGVAYFDTHIVRSKAETVMVVIDPRGRIARIEVLAFDEPPEYLPRPAWLRQFDGEALTDQLALKRAIRPMTGGTLTAHAILRASRRILAFHTVIAPFEQQDAP